MTERDYVIEFYIPLSIVRENISDYTFNLSLIVKAMMGSNSILFQQLFDIYCLLFMVYFLMDFM